MSEKRDVTALKLSWTERVVKAFGGYKREKPRDPDEARLLRERGTPEHLIGPVPVESLLDEDDYAVMAMEDE